MKETLLFLGLVSLLATTGCLVAEGERHGHYRGRGHHELVIVESPVLVVPAPVIVVRPP